MTVAFVPVDRSLPPQWTVPLGTVIIVALRWVVTPRGLDVVGPLALRDTLLTILLWLLVALLAAGAGRRLLERLRLRTASPPFDWILAEALGLGALSIWLLLLGLVGRLTPALISLSLISLSVLAARPTAEALAGFAGLPRRLQAAWRSSGFLPRLALLLL